MNVFTMRDGVCLCPCECRLEVNTKVFADIFKYLEDKGLQGELWGE